MHPSGTIAVWGVGVDVVTGEGLADALEKMETVIDAASFPSPEQQPANEFFVASKALADLATKPDLAPAGTNGTPIPQIAGPTFEEWLGSESAN